MLMRQLPRVASVLALFLLPANLEKLKDKILALEPGTRMVVNTFTVPDWEPDERVRVSGECGSWCDVLLHIVPAKVAEQIGPLRTLQVGLSGRNLLTLTNYSGLDPEVSNFGNQPIGRNYDVAPYPPSRSFWLSVTAGL